MRKFACLLLLAAFSLTAFTGCMKENTYTKRKEKLNGKTYIVLNEVKKAAESSKSNNIFFGEEKVGIGIGAFYLNDGSILYIKHNNEEFNSLVISKNINTITLEKNIEKEITNFKISPDRNKLLYTFRNRVIVMDLRGNLFPSPIIGIHGDALEESIIWKDNDNILYSCSDGNIYEKNIYSGKLTSYELDSIHKYNLHSLDDMIIYTSIPKSNVETLGKGSKLYEFFNEYSTKNGNSLNYTTERKNEVVIDWLSTYNIRSHAISPDGESIALYFEDNNRNSKLFIGSIGDGLLGSSFSKRGFIHISNERISKLSWSRDSKRLAYVVPTGDVGLFVVNEDGSDNNKVYSDAHISEIDWSAAGDTMLITFNEQSLRSIRKISLYIDIRK